MVPGTRTDLVGSRVAARGHDHEPPPASPRDLFECREPLRRVTIAQEDNGLGRTVRSEFTVGGTDFVDGCMTAIVINDRHIQARLRKTGLRGNLRKPNRQAPPPDGQDEPESGNCARHGERAPTSPGKSRAMTYGILH